MTVVLAESRYGVAVVAGAVAEAAIVLVSNAHDVAEVDLNLIANLNSTDSIPDLVPSFVCATYQCSTK